MSKEGSRRSKKSVPSDEWAVMSVSGAETMPVEDELPLGNGRAHEGALAALDGGAAVDEEAIKTAVVMMLKAIGEDPTREGLRDTPRRIAEMYRELFAGLHQDPAEVLRVSFDEGHSEMVIVKDIPFYTVCEHHFLPFYGVA